MLVLDLCSKVAPNLKVEHRLDVQINAAVFCRASLFWSNYRPRVPGFDDNKRLYDCESRTSLVEI
jgi:hypothetical protein